jgi:protein-S-isoprenylcysteine O-methyltransferase Ste14
MIFRHRFVWFTLVFAVGFALWNVDRVNATVALVHAVGWGDGAIRPAFAVGALFLVLAALIRTWAAAYLQTSVVHDVRVHTEKLVASGPYRYVRNPLYIGGLLLSLGMAMLASRIGAVVIVGGALALTLALIGEEERQLTAAQGESYAAYRRAVPSLVPSLTAHVPRANLAPRWGQAFLGEGMFWGLALGMILFAITLQPVWIVALGIGAPLVHTLVIRATRVTTPAGP